MNTDSKAVKAAKKYMLRSCGKGNVCACKKAKTVMASEVISIHAGSMISFAKAADDDHINQLPFKGILLLTDCASTKPPHGSRGHRIFVPTEVARKKLNGIVGMGINYDHHDLDSHETRHKVGVITKAWIKGTQVWVSGFVWKKDFPEAVKDLKRGGLGMSMELADVYVRDDNEDVWHLEDFEFTGATILKKSAAAYYGTELVASSVKKAKILTLAAAADGERKRKGDGQMEKNQKKERIAAASDTGQGALLVGAIKGAMSEGLAPLLAEIKASNDRTTSLRDDLEELKGLYMIQAAAHEDDEEDDEEMTAAKEDDEEDDEEMSADADSDDDDPSDRKKQQDDDDGEDDDLDAMEDLEKEAADQEPGEINKDADNRGNKTTVTRPPKQGEKVSGNIAKGRLSSSGMKAKGKPFPGLKSSASIQAAAVHINTLTAQVGKLKRQLNRQSHDMQAMTEQYKKQMKKLGGKYSALEAQAERWSEQVERKSQIPVDIRNLAAKNNVDLRELQASGEKVPVEVVDKWFAVAAQQGIQIEPSRREGMKTQLWQQGLMESGEIPFGGAN